VLEVGRQLTDQLAEQLVPDERGGENVRQRLHGDIGQSRQECVAQPVALLAAELDEDLLARAEVADDVRLGESHGIGEVTEGDRPNAAAHRQVACRGEDRLAALLLVFRTASPHELRAHPSLLTPC